MRQIPDLRSRSLGSLRADEHLVETLDEVVVFKTAPRALGQSAAIAEAGRGVRAVDGGRLGPSTAQDDRGTPTAAAGTPGGTAGGRGEHVIRVHRPQDQALADRPAGPAEPARDLVPAGRPVVGRTSNTFSGILRQRSEAGEADCVQVQHPAVVDHRYGDVRWMMVRHIDTRGRWRREIRSSFFTPFG